MNVYTSDPQDSAVACIIWMHGLGADAQDMGGLAEQIRITYPVRHVFMNAPIRPVTINNNMEMRAWYDIAGADLIHREDKKGITESDSLINEVIAKEINAGFTSKQIFLAGFSQGGAMALYTGMRYQQPLAGIIALSSYIPLAKECIIAQDKTIPTFVAYGKFDEVVRPEWTKKTLDWLHAQGVNRIAVHDYPMAHAVCIQELNDITDWLNSQLADISSQSGGKQ